MKTPKELLFAFAMYYANRGLQYNIHTTYQDGQTSKFWTENTKRPKWDKEADLKLIFKAKNITSIQATAGTFWIKFKNKKATYCMTESTFPNLVKLKEGQFMP